jgi:hypothetical protein
VSKDTSEVGPVSNTEAFKVAEHWRRYAHRVSLVFKRDSDQWYCFRYSRGALKRAMLAVGTRGHIFVLGEGPHGARVGWREACARLRSADTQDQMI